MPLQRKMIIVTGSSAWLDLACAQHFATQSADVLTDVKSWSSQQQAARGL